MHSQNFSNVSHPGQVIRQKFEEQISTFLDLGRQRGQLLSLLPRDESLCDEMIEEEAHSHRLDDFRKFRSDVVSHGFLAEQSSVPSTPRGVETPMILQSL